MKYAQWKLLSFSRVPMLRALSNFVGKSRGIYITLGQSKSTATRRLVLALSRLTRKRGFCFMVCGLRATRP
jgi:hypothetical protein